MAHIVVMQHVTREVIDGFFDDLKTDGAPDLEHLKQADDKEFVNRHWHQKKRNRKTAANARGRFIRGSIYLMTVILPVADHCAFEE